MVDFTDMDQGIEIAEGVFKQVGSCTADDLDGAGRVFREKAQLNVRIADLALAIADGMKAQDKTGVEIDPDLRRRLDNSHHLDVPLTELRTLAADLEAAAPSFFDE